MRFVPKILAFAGSLRADSYNKKLLAIAVKGARSAGAEVTVVDLNDHMLPLFNEDLEKAQGLPVKGRELKDMFLSHHGILIASPEYNGSFTAVLKNTLDWISRPGLGEPSLIAFDRKVGAVLSASPGGLGGLRSQAALRALLQEFRMLVLPDQVAIARAFEAFTPEGDLKDGKLQASVVSVGKKLVLLISQTQDVS